MRFAVLHRAVVIALLAACGNREEKPRTPTPGTVEGLGAIPAEAKIVLGVNVSRLAQAQLVRRTITRVLAEDAALAARVNGLLETCHVDPVKDVETVHIGILDDGTAYVMVARGNFDEARLVECVRQSLATSSTTLETRSVANAPAYVAKDASGAEKGWFAFGGPKILILAATEAWMAKARDPAAGKVTGAGDMMGLVHRTDTTRALWGAGHLPDRVGKAIVDVSGGIVKVAPTGSWGHFDAGDQGLDLEVNLEMASDEDALGLSEFAKKQLGNLTALAQTQGLGPKVAKIQLSATAKVAKLSLKLSAQELAELEAQLEKGKEGVTP